MKNPSFIDLLQKEAGECIQVKQTSPPQKAPFLSTLKQSQRSPPSKTSTTMQKRATDSFLPCNDHFSYIIHSITKTVILTFNCHHSKLYHNNQFGNKEMQINHSLSRLSVLSNARSNHSKHSPSTQPQESPEQHSSNSNQAFELDYPSLQFNKLENQIERIEKAQAEMEAKYNRYIEHMLQEIQRNNENNARLAKEVSVLAQQIEESKKDILIIDEFLNTKTQKKQSKVQPQNQLKIEPRRQSNRAQFGSSSRSKNLLLRRTPSKAFKSKLTFKA